MPGWRRYANAGALYGRRDYGAAAAIYEAIVAEDPSDAFAAFMVANCYEHQGRVGDALPWAEAAARGLPDSLAALQAAARLSIASDDHEKAAGYVRRSLALPELTTGMPHEDGLTRVLRWLLRLLHRAPIELEPGYRAIELQEWKEWAQGYLAWGTSNGGAPPQTRPH